MASFRYTVEELLHLSQSPLAVRPDNLPNIEQWFEPQTQNKNRNSTAARPDENENPKQRNLSQAAASLGGTRFTARKDGEEVFLGPKMSFASASAARQANKTSFQDSDELRKFDRFAARDKDTLRDRDSRSGEGRRDRHRETNGVDADGKPRFGRTKLSVDEDEERGGKFKTRTTGGRDEDVKRAGRAAGRAKFDQPWFRDATKDAPADEANEVKSAWREEKPRRAAAADKDWSRKFKSDEDPGWELSGQTSSEPAARTIDDFQRWKERMKAGDSAAPPADGVDVPAEPEPVAEKPKAMIPASFFGNLGAPDDSPSEVTTPKPSGTKKSGKSRFQSFFGANEELDQLGHPAPEHADEQQQQQQQQQQHEQSRQAQLPSPSEPHHQSQHQLQSQPQNQPQSQPQDQQQLQPPTTRSEDQAGFERMMAMLRMGGAGSQGPGPQLFASPPPASQKQNAPNGPPPGLPAFFDNNPASPPASAATRPIPAPTPPSQQTNSRPQPLPTPDRNSEFLLNLMKSQQPRTPFTEGQIYGQGYERKTPDAASARYPPPPPPSAQSRGQPSRFFNNEQAFANNAAVDRGLASATQSPQRNDDSMRHAKEQPAVPPGFDQPPFHMFGGRPPSPQRMPPPPGFPNRPPPPASQHIPPGFFNGAPQYPPHLVGQQPGGGPMRGPMQPPGFFHAPPGFPNLPPGMHHGPPPGQRRSGGIPPGFDVFAGGPGPNGRQMMGVGGPPPPSAQQGHMQNQGGYAQYAQQMGAGNYKGIS